MTRCLIRYYPFVRLPPSIYWYRIWRISNLTSNDEKEFFYALATSTFANVAAASTAGYSSTSTNVDAKESSGKSVSVHATSTTYDASAQLAATQNAANT